MAAHVQSEAFQDHADLHPIRRRDVEPSAVVVFEATHDTVAEQVRLPSTAARNGGRLCQWASSWPGHPRGVALATWAGVPVPHGRRTSRPSSSFVIADLALASLMDRSPRSGSRQRQRACAVGSSVQTRCSWPPSHTWLRATAVGRATALASGCHRPPQCRQHVREIGQIEAGPIVARLVEHDKFEAVIFSPLALAAPRWRCQSPSQGVRNQRAAWPRRSLCLLADGLPVEMPLVKERLPDGGATISSSGSRRASSDAGVGICG